MTWWPKWLTGETGQPQPDREPTPEEMIALAVWTLNGQSVPSNDYTISPTWSWPLVGIRHYRVTVVRGGVEREVFSASAIYGELRVDRFNRGEWEGPLLAAADKARAEREAEQQREREEAFAPFDPASLDEATAA